MMTEGGTGRLLSRLDEWLEQIDGDQAGHDEGEPELDDEEKVLAAMRANKRRTWFTLDWFHDQGFSTELVNSLIDKHYSGAFRVAATGGGCEAAEAA